MRNFTLAAILLGLLSAPALMFGQAPSKKKALVSPEQMNAKASYQAKQDQALRFEDTSILTARPAPVAYTPPVSGKVNAVNPVAIGRASNAFTCLRGEQNQVFASDSYDMVLFMHRQDVTIWGGGGTENGKYRYDFSLDDGSTFVNDIGAMQNVYTNFGRYPNTTVYQSGTTGNPFSDLSVLYMGPTNAFPTPGWVGHVYGVSELTTTNPPASTPTEHYLFGAENTLLPGGLTEGLDGEFWAAETQWDGAAAMDSIRVMKGTWNTTTNDVDWITFAKLDAMYDKSFDGSISVVGPNVAFSADGMNGYIAYLANTTTGTGTNNSNLNPCFFNTTDGGVTWGGPIEVDLDGIPWIADSLQTLWVEVDTISGDTNPASDGRATCAFDFDVVVDGNGNPHLGVVVGTAADGFSISSGLAKFVADVWSPDGGATWNAKYISPVLAFRGDFGTGDPITMDNYVQMSTDEAGERIFISWEDSDTAAVTGNQNGIGFGVVDQLAPNLRISSWRVADGFQTCPKLLTDGDFIWEGRSLMSTMAPTVLNPGGGSTYNLPIVSLEMITNDPINPCAFHYFGSDATIDNSDYQDPNSLILSWDNIVLGCPLVGVEDVVGNEDVQLFQSYPNPTTGEANIMFELPATMNVTLDVVNMYGQQVATILDTELGSGMHEAVINTSDLSAGVYFYNLRTNDQVLTKRMVVAK